jgi:hypothetical protein
MKIYTYVDPYKFTVKVGFISGEKGEVKTAFNFGKGKAYTIQPGEALPEGCLMEIPQDVFDEMLKAFAEMASDRGIKLESDLKREGKLEATAKHLEDMRALVFKDTTPPKS